GVSVGFDNAAVEAGAAIRNVGVPMEVTPDEAIGFAAYLPDVMLSEGTRRGGLVQVGNRFGGAGNRQIRIGRKKRPLATGLDPGKMNFSDAAGLGGAPVRRPGHPEFPLRRDGQQLISVLPHGAVRD